MKLAIMQPYLFPYIGYYQLLAAVDKFVFYDDVNFIKNGWINRNRLYLAGDVRYFTAPLSGASPFLKINEISVQAGDGWRKRIVESVRHSYAKAPHFHAVNEIISDVLFSPDTRVADLAKRSVTRVADYLGLTTQCVMSSTVYDNANLHGVERVLDICLKENAAAYYNLPGGRALYDQESFQSRNIDLYFISPQLPCYRQFSPEFQTGLSIIDMLMFNDKLAARQMLNAEASR